MKLIVDFDDTIFDTGKLKEVIFSTLHKIGIHNGEELYMRERAKETPFSLHSFLHRICTENGYEGESNLLYENIMEECHPFVNKALISILQNTGKENCYVVTHGDDTFQRDKINSTKVSDLVEEVIVVPGSKKEIIESLCARFPNEEIIFVDDKSRFFNDIHMEICPNLKTVLYNEHGLTNLMAEIEASRREEQNKKADNENSVFPKMR